MSKIAFLLDTDIASFLIAGRNRSLQTRFAAVPQDTRAVSVITAAELLFGLERLPVDHKRQSTVKRFLTLTPVLDWNLAVAQVYAGIRHHLASSNQLIGELDMMIAAHALSLDATLITNNTRHFARLAPSLRLENWTETNP